MVYAAYISCSRYYLFLEAPEGGERKDNLRKPLSGKLQVTIKGARELDHAPFLRSGRSLKPINETAVIIKVEGTPRARSHPSRTDRWMEDFEISVDKANEVEIAVYDKQVGADVAVPIGLLWVNLGDIVEALRRAKVQEEGKGGGWVTAGAMRDGQYSAGPGPDAGFVGMGVDTPLQFAGAPGGDIGAPGLGPQQPEGIEAWFAVEPAGALALRLNFGATQVFLSIFKTHHALRIIKSRKTSGSGLLMQVVSDVKAPSANAKARSTR